MTLPAEDPRPAAGDTNTGPGAQEKDQSREESVAGWAFMMRPLRRKGAKASASASASASETAFAPAPAARIDTSASKESDPQIASQPEDDRDSAQSKGSSYGLRHTDTLREVTSEDGLLPGGGNGNGNGNEGHRSSTGNGEGNSGPHHEGSAPRDGAPASEGPRFKVYKRRWFGVVQLVLLNTIVSWDVSANCCVLNAERGRSILCAPRARERMSPNLASSAC